VFATCLCCKYEDNKIALIPVNTGKFEKLKMEKAQRQEKNKNKGKIGTEESEGVNGSDQEQDGESMEE